MEKYNFKTAINIDDSNEPFLAVLEYILIPKYINFYGKAGLSRPAVGESKDSQSVETASSEERSAWLISNKESSFKGHTVNALVLTGDEGRVKLR